MKGASHVGHTLGLKYCELLSRLSPEQITRIESRSRSRSFPARSPVCLPAEKADSVFLVGQGRLKVCRPVANGQEAMPVFVEPGELFGETAIFDGDEQDDHVEAVAASTVVMTPAGEMRHLMAEGANVALSIRKMVGLRRHRIERRLGSLLFLSYRERLVQLLLGLAEQFGRRRDVEDGIRLRIKLSHQEPLRLLLHVALRAPREASIVVDGENVVPHVHAVLDKMAEFSNRVRSGDWTGHTGRRIRHVINIGMGGSDLGPVMAYEALKHYSDRTMTFRFVSNVDGTDIVEATRDLDPAETLFIVSSKTFTTCDFIDEFAEAGSDSFLVHWESNHNLHRTVQRIKALGKRVGVVINPATPAAVPEEILQDVNQPSRFLFYERKLLCKSE